MARLAELAPLGLAPVGLTPMVLALPGRVHVGLTASAPVRRLPSAVTCVDALLDGGWPRGRVSEVLGPLSSGKTSLVLTLLAAATRRGEVVACVDLADALHPQSIARAGADLQRVLWVRPPSVTDAMRCTELLVHAGGFALVVLDLGAQPPRRLPSHVWPRLMRAAEQSYTAVIVLAPQRVTGSFSALSLGVRARTALWQGPLFEGFDMLLELTRNKLGAPGRQIVMRAR
jgi:hypothetical protein